MHVAAANASRTQATGFASKWIEGVSGRAFEHAGGGVHSSPSSPETRGTLTSTLVPHNPSHILNEVMGSTQIYARSRRWTQRAVVHTCARCINLDRLMNAKLNKKQEEKRQGNAETRLRSAGRVELTEREL